MQPATIDNPKADWPTDSSRASIAILCSGGVDSAVLLGEALKLYRRVHPVYIRVGMQWESIELQWLCRYLSAVAGESLAPLVELEQPVRDIYGNHWSITGRDVPDEKSADEAVFLPGRNVLLLAKAMLWCHLHDVAEIAMAPLAANPFPDATPEFFSAFAAAVNMAVVGSVRVIRPYARLKKTHVLQRGSGLPLQFTYSCIQPAGVKHCGRCNKCAERHHAFIAAGLQDPTDYDRPLP